MKTVSKAIPTIRDVARKAGVGQATVSRVMNGSAPVAEATRAAVQQAIAELGFVPNPHARRLSLGKTFTVAAIVPFFTRPSFVERLRGIESVLAPTPYDLIVFNVESVERRDKYFAEVPHPDRVDGALIMSFTPRDHDVARFRRSGVPVVLVDAYHPKLHSVHEDSERGGFLATQHLIELGHQRIGFISDTFDDPFNFTSRSYSRFEGYRKALKTAGIHFHETWHRQGEHSRLMARHLTLEILQAPDAPTAIFAASDTQAMGVLEAARALKLRVPADLSVIGYDDLEIAEYLGLTTVRQALFESGQKGAELLLAALENPTSKISAVKMPVELVQRKTTAPAPKLHNGRR